MLKKTLLTETETVQVFRFFSMTFIDLLRWNRERVTFQGNRFSDGDEFTHTLLLGLRIPPQKVWEAMSWLCHFHRKRCDSLGVTLELFKIVVPKKTIE